MNRKKKKDFECFLINLHYYLNLNDSPELFILNYLFFYDRSKAQLSEAEIEKLKAQDTFLAAEGIDEREKKRSPSSSRERNGKQSIRSKEIKKKKNKDKKEKKCKHHKEHKHHKKSKK